MTEKEYAKHLYEKTSIHVKYWDCYNDCPLEFNHHMKLCYLFLDALTKEYTEMDEDSELLYKEKCLFPEEKIKYFVKVKKEIKKLFK